MKITGLQKLTLLDFPEKVSCTVFFGGCNFRCPFCHNADLVLPGAFPDGMEPEALLRFLKKRQGVLDGVCISGGEPLLQRQLPDLIARIKDLGFAVKLDTNGSFPDRLAQLVQQGLVDYVAMDIKNAPEHYPETIGAPGFDIAPVRESAVYLMGGTLPFEFRTTVVKELHSAEDFASIGRWIAGAPRYFLQGFVDSGNLIAPGLHACTREEMEKYRKILLPFVPETRVRGV